MNYENGSTPTIVFFLADEGDGETAETGLTPTVYISKNGGTAATTTNAASEIDATNMPGWYKVVLTATETNTDGPLIVRSEVSGTTKVWLEVHQVGEVAASLTSTVGNFIADHVLRRAASDAGASSNGDTLDIASLIGMAAIHEYSKSTAGVLSVSYDQTDPTNTVIGTITPVTDSGADPWTGTNN